VIVGCPRYDLEFGRYSAEDRDAVKQRLGFGREEKVVLILPTAGLPWSIGCTRMDDFLMIDSAIEALKVLGLEDEVKIAVKFHPRHGRHVYQSFCESRREKFGALMSFSRNLHELYIAADICISGYSTTVLEAMLYGKPSIVFDRYYKKEVIPYVGMGAAVGASDAGEMASAIGELINDPDAHLRLKANHERFIRYSLYRLDGKATERTCDFIRGLLSGQDGGSAGCSMDLWKT
jgi:CDP-glycerol glycerophosphotransferase (TagB/SpsB family)